MFVLSSMRKNADFVREQVCLSMFFKYFADFNGAYYWMISASDANVTTITS